MNKIFAVLGVIILLLLVIIIIPHNTVSNTAINTYLIELNNVPEGKGMYQQLININLSYPYGINSNGSNILFKDGSNNTFLYAWIQSINATNLQVWIKNYNNSILIEMMILPSFENLFSATGYLGEASQLSSIYGEYFNVPLVFGYNSISWDFAGTSVNGWSGLYKVNNGLTITSGGINTNLTFNPFNYTVLWAFSGNTIGRYGGIAGNYASWVNSYSSTQFSLNYYLNGTAGFVVMNGNINSNYNSIIYGERPIGIFAYLNNNPISTYNNTDFANQTTPENFYFASDGITVYYVILLPQTAAMPIFTIAPIGTAPNPLYLSNSFSISNILLMDGKVKL